MKKRIQKSLSLLLALLMLLSLLTACSNSAAPAETEQTGQTGETATAASTESSSGAKDSVIRSRLRLTPTIRATAQAFRCAPTSMSRFSCSTMI